MILPPATPATRLSATRRTGNRYAGVLLDQGWTSVSGDNITGGNVGIGVLQYNGQAFAADGTAFLDVIRNASIAAVQVESDRAASGDNPGALALSFSQLRGNGARVLNNSSNYTVNLLELLIQAIGGDRHACARGSGRASRRSVSSERSLRALR